MKCGNCHTLLMPGETSCNECNRGDYGAGYRSEAAALTLRTGWPKIFSLLGAVFGLLISFSAYPGMVKKPGFVISMTLLTFFFVIAGGTLGRVFGYLVQAIFGRR